MYEALCNSWPQLGACVLFRSVEKAACISETLVLIWDARNTAELAFAERLTCKNYNVSHRVRDTPSPQRQRASATGTSSVMMRLDMRHGGEGNAVDTELNTGLALVEAMLHIAVYWEQMVRTS